MAKKLMLLILGTAGMLVGMTLAGSNCPGSSKSYLPDSLQRKNIAELEQNKINEEARLITVKVIGDVSGSGIIIQGQGRVYTVLTNEHVANKGKSYEIQTHDGQIYQAKHIGKKIFGSNDLALLEFRSGRRYETAIIGELKNVLENDYVFAAGYPAEGDVNIDSGFIVYPGRVLFKLNQPLLGGYKVGMSNNLEKGMSGGPLVNSKGEVVGINGRHRSLWGGGQGICAYQYEDLSPACEDMRVEPSSWTIPVETFVALVPPDIIASEPRDAAVPTITPPPVRQPLPSDRDKPPTTPAPVDEPLPSDRDKPPTTPAPVDEPLPSDRDKPPTTPEVEQQPPPSDRSKPPTTPEVVQQQSPSDRAQPPTTPEVVVQQPLPSGQNAFWTARNEREKAKKQLKTAKSSSDWRAAVSIWSRAIELYQQVPESDPKHADAQKEIVQEQQHLSYVEEMLEKSEAQAPKPLPDPFWAAQGEGERATRLINEISNKSPEDWIKIASHLQKALDWMITVPDNHPLHQNAEKRIIQYRKDIKYAEEQASSSQSE